MSRTYSAEISRYRMKELHPEYLRQVEELRRIPPILRFKEPRYITCCPFCGTYDELYGDVKVGSKRFFRNVKLTVSGYNVSGVRSRSTQELVIVRCKACKASIHPVAYLSPIVFVNEREIVRAILNS